MTFLTGVAFGAFLSASGADAVTTHLALSRGAVESNPALVNPAVMVSVKATTGALTWIAAARWEKEHPKATRLLLVIGAGAYAGIAAHNWSVYEHQRGR